MLLVVTASVTILPAGCSSSGEKKEDEAAKANSDKKTELKNVNDDEAERTKKIAVEYIDDILLGMKNNDYPRFSKNMVDELKQDITKEKFVLMTQKFKEEKGDIAEKQFLGTLGKGYFKVYLWKTSFVKKDAKTKDKELKDDTLTRLILGKVDDKYVVFGFSFQ